MQCKALSREYKYEGFSVQKDWKMPKGSCRWYCEIHPSYKFTGNLLVGFTRKEVFSQLDVLLDK